MELGSINYVTKFTDTQLPHNKIPEKTIIIVRKNNLMKWALMQCPCGCGEILTLSLMKSVNPFWDVKFDKLKRLSLSPSIHKSDGCCSHFYIKKGKVVWAFYY